MVLKHVHIMEFLLTVIMAVQLQSILCGKVQTKMVFEAFSDGDDTSYDLYMGKGVSTQNPGPKIHFKDPLVNMWGKQILVHKVTVVVIKNSKEKASVVFNGTGTTKTSWLTQDRIMSSSYTDIKTKAANYFSVDGHVLSDKKGRRAFYMNKSFSGCDSDAGWIQVLVGNGFCQWEESVSRKTVVSFIPQSYAGIWSKNIQTADSMRIIIEYEEIPVSSATSSSSSSSEKMTTDAFTTLSIKGSTEKTTTTSTSTLVKDTTCQPCSCGSNQSGKNITLPELKQEVQQLKAQLRVDRTKLSSSVRLKTSAVDKRPSATAVGGVIGGAVMAAVFCAIVIPDILKLGRYVRTKLGHRKIKTVC